MPTTVTTTTAEEAPISSLRFTAEGQVVDGERTADGRSVLVTERQLQGIARTAGIPWSAQYASSGGASALIALFAAVSADQEPSGAEPVGVEPDPVGSPAAEARTNDRPGTGDRPSNEGEAEDDAERAERLDLGFVYTPTTLYGPGSGRVRNAPADDAEQPDGAAEDGPGQR